MGTLFVMDPWSWCEAGIGGNKRINKGCQLPGLHSVRMNYRGLVNPKNKPFGRVLPLEVQVKIMFWVHCFYTIDRRKKVVQELKGLPKCDLKGYPQILGEGRHWNQVVMRLHAPRRNGCHHCHRLMDHRMSVSERFFCCVRFEKIAESLFFLVTDWHDGGNGTCPSQSRQPDERGHCICH